MFLNQPGKQTCNYTKKARKKRLREVRNVPSTQREDTCVRKVTKKTNKSEKRSFIYKTNALVSMSLKPDTSYIKNDTYTKGCVATTMHTKSPLLMKIVRWV